MRHLPSGAASGPAVPLAPEDVPANRAARALKRTMSRVCRAAVLFCGWVSSPAPRSPEWSGSGPLDEVSCIAGEATPKDSSVRRDIRDRDIPTQIGDGADWADVSVGRFLTCARRTDGSARCTERQWPAGYRRHATPKRFHTGGVDRRINTDGDRPSARRRARVARLHSSLQSALTLAIAELCRLWFGVKLPFITR
jgi:hypothetical protein